MLTLELQVVREPAEGMAGLRRELAAAFTCGNPIRDEAYRQALSATVWRLVHFGIEAGLGSYTALDLANISLIAEGPLVEHLVRTGYTRAMVENDLPLLDLYGRQGLSNSTRAWHQDLERSEESAVPAILANLAGEELHVARLVIARRWPAAIAPSWLWDIPVEGDLGLPLVAYHLAAAQLALRPDLRESTSSYLAQHRGVLLCREPDALLVPLVLASSATPQTVLEPFTGCYGDPVMVAAGAWHLEHRQPREAWSLTHRMRPLSPHADDAWTIAGLAAVELGHLQDAEELRQRIVDQAGRDRLLLAIAEAQPEAVPTERLVAAAKSCGTDHPELFYRLLKMLLQRRELGLARAIALEKQASFANEPRLQSILSTIIG